MTRRAALYCRISQDREGAGLGVARQESDCRALTDRLGWSVAEVYVDNDTSAYSGTPRPAWNRMIEDVKAGVVDAVVCWHVDRLTRSPRELEDVIDLADRHGLALATVTGEIDLATPTGRMVARVVGAAARHEAEHKAERQARQRRQAAEAGKVAGGGGRPFGYAEDRITVVEPEAAVIQECAARVLAGESLSSVCRDLAERGISTVTGVGWKPTMLRRLLASARISGRREHTPVKSWSGTRPLLGEIVAEDAVWPAIISPRDSDRLRAVLSSPDRRKYSPANGRKYLLTGILRCGRCGGGLIGRPREGVPRYVCSNTPGGTTCGKLAMAAEPAEDFMRAAVLTALNSPEVAQALTSAGQPEPAIGDQIRDDEDQLADLAAAWARREITRIEWTAARGVIEERLERARKSLAQRSGRDATALVDGSTYEEMDARWEGLNVSQRRAVVTAVIEQVVVQPGRPGKGWKPDRLEIVWRS